LITNEPSVAESLTIDDVANPTPSSTTCVEFSSPTYLVPKLWLDEPDAKIPKGATWV